VQSRKQEFEALVAPHFEALYEAAYRLTRRAHDAEDLVQEVCLRAYLKLDDIKTLEYVRGWLLRVQYRLFVDGDRRRRRSPFTGDSGTGEAEANWVSDAPGPEALTEASLVRRRLEAAWRRLSAEQRALLGLHAAGYDLSELERITGKGRNAISARLHRARRRLAKLLGFGAESAEFVNPSVNNNEL
jgi:RNA polymerase sigma factor (sigma-70 family)